MDFSTIITILFLLVIAFFLNRYKKKKNHECLCRDIAAILDFNEKPISAEAIFQMLLPANRHRVKKTANLGRTLSDMELDGLIKLTPKTKQNNHVLYTLTATGKEELLPKPKPVVETTKTSAEPNIYSIDDTTK